jgi:hypothetical protein
VIGGISQKPGACFYPPVVPGVVIQYDIPPPAFQGAQIIGSIADKVLHIGNVGLGAPPSEDRDLMAPLHSISDHGRPDETGPPENEDPL